MALEAVHNTLKLRQRGVANIKRSSRFGIN